MSGLEPPYRLIRKGLETGTVIPFLGAGASLGAAVAGGEAPGSSPTEGSQRTCARGGLPGGGGS